MNQFAKGQQSPRGSTAQRCTSVYLCAALLCVATACGHDQKQPVTPNSGPASTARAPQAKAPPAVHREAIVVSEQIKEVCKLPETPKQEPQFDFDEAALRSRGESILDGVAACMLTGPMKDEQLVVTGHADPRGGEAYNQELGMRRSSSAQEYLVSRGVPAARIDVQSHGETDATGTDESSWQLDRRVDLDAASQKIGSNRQP
jgi:outer membrane protein OmpA-like peptidoglycan-associated protein